MYPNGSFDAAEDSVSADYTSNTLAGDNDDQREYYFGHTRELPQPQPQPQLKALWPPLPQTRRHFTFEEAPAPAAPAAPAVQPEDHHLIAEPPSPQQNPNPWIVQPAQPVSFSITPRLPSMPDSSALNPQMSKKNKPNSKNRRPLRLRNKKYGGKKPITANHTRAALCNNNTRPKPMLPADKDAAPHAAWIASRAHDPGRNALDRFKCTALDCGKHFLRRYNLKVHARIHTGETPYVCKEPGCYKKFKWRSSIAHHQKAHRNNDPQGNVKSVLASGVGTMSQTPGETVDAGGAPVNSEAIHNGEGTSDFRADADKKQSLSCPDKTVPSPSGEPPFSPISSSSGANVSDTSRLRPLKPLQLAAAHFQQPDSPAPDTEELVQYEPTAYSGLNRHIEVTYQRPYFQMPAEPLIAYEPQAMYNIGQNNNGIALEDVNFSAPMSGYHLHEDPMRTDPEHEGMHIDQQATGEYPADAYIGGFDHRGRN